MKLRFCLLFFFLTFVVCPSRFTFGEEKYLEFLQGLRDRNYFDYAILYLDQLSQRPALPAELRPVILYEKAITLRDSSRSLRVAEKQTEQLDQALAFLEQFAKDFPDHPRAGDANFDRAAILLQKASVEINQAKSPSNKGSKSEFQARGRDLVRRARDVLKLAHDQHEATVKAFPTFIDEQKDPKLHAERERVTRALVVEAMELARCAYEEAQTYDPASREFKQTLTEAIDEFEKVYVPYRTQLGGQLARAWQGKCYEEQGELQQAMAIYDNILEQPEDDPSFQNLKAQTLLFKLICLHKQGDSQQGEPQKEVYQHVVDFADEWLKKNAGDSKTAIGLGIQWEQARAQEALGDNRNLPPPDQARFWRQAQMTAQNISKFSGEYKDHALAMTQRLQGKLGGKESKPQTFEAAYSQAAQAFQAAQAVKKELESATKQKRPQEELTRLTQDWTSALHDAARNFELAITLVGKKDSLKEVTNARYFQAQSYFYLGKYYEAAVLGTFVARTTADDENNMALDAAYIAMLAFNRAYFENRAEPDKKQDDLRLVIKSANFIAERWPDSDKANEARMTLGRMYATDKNPSEAAEWFSKVPESDAKYPEAQLAAGQAYWLAYNSASRQPPEQRPSAEKLSEWKVIAEKHLRTGIDKLSATLPKEGAVPIELVSTKFNLAQIMLSQGKPAESAKILLDDPQSLVKAVSAPDEANRPASGPQSRLWAMNVNKLLLLSYISLGHDKLNEARDTMKKLEAIASGDPGADLTELYVGLGRGLKAELEQFRANGETERFDKQMEAFELFLDDIFKRQEGQTLGSLSWIGETYATLGEISTDRGKTATYYDRATSAFNRIVSRSQNEADFVSPDQLLNVKVRLVHCNRLKKDFEPAEQMLIEVLKARGNDLRTQVEGAYVYQDWGSNADHNKLIIAISGRKDIGLWGWGGVAKRLQQQKSLLERPDLIDLYIDARYNVTLCRYRYVRELGPKDKPKGLEACAKELVGTVGIFKTIPDDKRNKLNELYRDVLQEWGKPIVNLPKNAEIQVESPAAPPEKSKEESDSTENMESTADSKTADSKTAESKSAAKTAKKEPAAAEGEVGWVGWLFLFAVLAGGGVMIGRVVLNSKKPRTKSAKKNMTVKSPGPVLGFTGIAFEKEDKEKEKPAPAGFSLAAKPAAPKPRPKPAAASGAAPPTGQRTAARPPARPEGASPPAKPRPKPPPPPANE